MSERAVWLDHFVIGIDVLERGMEEVEDLTGVRLQPGGAHPNLGTHNALASLGESAYLEVLAPQPGRPLSPLFGASAHCSTLTPIRWAVATDRLDTLHDQLLDAGFEPQPIVVGSRQTQSGETLTWRMFMLDQPPGPGEVPSPQMRPFVIEWGPGVTHPARTTPPGLRVEGFEIRSRQGDRLRALFALLDLSVPIADGEEGMTVRLGTPHGPRSIG